jgi:hypothetical protein
MANVQLPTGETIAMPDNPTPQDISDFQQVLNISQRRAVAQTPETTSGPAGFANGLAELAGKGLLSIPYMAGHAVNDMSDMLHGRPQGATPDGDILKTLHPDLSPNALQVAQSIGATKAGQTAQDVYHAAQTAEPELTRAVGDVASVTPAGEALSAAGGVVKDAGAAVARQVGSAIDAVKPGAGLNASGLAPQDQIVARRLANDKTVTQAATQQNQQVGNAIAGRVAGTNLGDPEAPSRLAMAREPANAVYNRIATQMPTAPLTADADTAAAIQSAGSGGAVTRGSPNSRADIADMKTALLNGNPISGQKLVDTSRSLRRDGFAGRNSADPDQQHLGDAKIDMANALDDHIERNLPQGADVSPEQFQQARVALAQSHTVEGLLTPGGNVNLQELARLHRDHPNLLTGDLRDLANFAGQNPLVTRPADGMLAPDAIKDLKNSVSIVHPVSTLLNGIGGGTLARRIVSDSGAAERINPLPPRPLQGFDRLDPLRNGLDGGQGPAVEPLQRDLLDQLKGGSPHLSSSPIAPGTPTNGTLEPPPGTAFEPHQRDFFGGADQVPPPGSVPAAPAAGPAPPRGPGPGYIPPPAAPVGLGVGEGKASPAKSKVKSGPTDYGRNLVESPPSADLGDLLGVGEGKASPVKSPAKSGPSNYADLATEQPAAAPVGLGVGEGKASPVKSPAKGGAPAREPDPAITLSVGEGKASPGASRVKSGPSDYAKNLGDLFKAP